VPVAILPIKEHLLMVNDVPRGQRYLEAMQLDDSPTGECGYSMM
jgi:hypothetical protein